jgi:Ca2+-binding EF-hand superfamily protein|tara:strand:+ start:3014 stop:3211 length:198 start_codon:yes stop_codon:yes gene_type:complete
MIIRKLNHNRRIKSIKFDERNLDEMADHLIGKRLSVYRENVYDTDGDGKVTLKDFIQRIKDVDKG